MPKFDKYCFQMHDYKPDQPISVSEANFAQLSLHTKILCHSWLDANEAKFVEN